MSLASAITALSPDVYWKLDEPLGATSVADSSGHGRSGTVTGDVGLGAYGPEWGTYATRLYSTGSIKLTNWLGTAWRDLSVMVLATTPGTVPSPSPSIFLGIGDSANPATRGMYLANVSTGSNTATYRWSTPSSLGSNAMPYPPTLWHVLTWTYTLSTNLKQLYTDSTVGSSSTGTQGAAFNATDSLYLTSTWPIVVSHVAVWPRTLTTAEVTSVGSLVTTWPYQWPINVPYEVSAPTIDLSPVLSDTAIIKANQTSMMPIVTNTNTIVTTTEPVINQTQTDTHNIVNSLFPQLGVFLSTIDSKLVSTFETAVGAVTRTLGEIFSGHSKDQLGVYNPTDGPTCEHISLNIGAAAYWGLGIEITTVPTEWAFTTPGGDWSIRDLAVLTLSIAGDQVFRTGIHTMSYSLSPLPEMLPLAVAGVGIPIAPPQYYIDVKWAGGVCGQLLLYYVPV